MIFFISKESYGLITRTNGIMLLGFLCLYLYAIAEDAFKSIRKKDEIKKMNYKDALYIAIGLFGIILGGELVVSSATRIAQMFNISERIIALTIVAIGTSLPEIVTSVVAIKKGITDIAIGNVIGSNIFNVFFVLGLSSTISPITFGMESFIDVIVMFLASIVVYIMLRNNKKIDKKASIILLSIYVLYMIGIFIR